MQKHSKIQHFQQALDSEDGSKSVIQVSESLISLWIFLHGILQRESDTAEQDDKHDEAVKKWSCDKPMESYSGTEKNRMSLKIPFNWLLLRVGWW